MPAVYFHSLGCLKWHNVFDALGQGETAHVWKMRINENKQLLDFFGSGLYDNEIEKLSRFHQQKDRQRFIVSRGALRFLLAKYLDIAADKIGFSLDKNKKPILAGMTDSPVHFNISHSADWIVMAFSVYPIGVDVEKIDNAYPYREILAMNFSREEINYIEDTPQPRSNFYLLWTRKEALAKATAAGIHDELKLMPTLDGMRQIDDQIIGSTSSWRVSSFSVDEHYTGSIACAAGVNTINFFEATPSFFLQPV
jgi:4'-phosphopantetheinyl transferase